MKKFLSFAAIALCVSFTSCSDDDDNYVPKPIDVSKHRCLHCKLRKHEFSNQRQHHIY